MAAGGWRTSSRGWILSKPPWYPIGMQYCFDKRTFDNNGHMHVSDCRITAASVDEYLGSEVDGSAEHGFGPLDRIRIYRDAAELEKALSSFDSVPLLIVHELTTAADPKKDLIVGTVSNPRFGPPFVRADLTFWDQAGIDLVISKEQADLSAGYARDLDWTPGISPDGLQYDARMFNIKCNHVAIVRNGRVAGAIVADKAIEESMFDKLKFPKIVAAILGLVGAERKEETALALDAALDSELMEAPEIVHAKKKKKGAQVNPESSEVTQDEEEKKAAEKAEAEKKAAMDAAIAEGVEKVVKERVDAAVAATHALYAAKEAVSPVVGDVSLDSAEKVYRFALEKAGVDHANVAADGLGPLWESSQKKPSVSFDSGAAPLDGSSLFPGLSFIRKG